jgi:hypothetical protein
MKLTTKLTNLGIELTANAGSDSKPLEFDKNADQHRPRQSYVYAHLDRTGTVFYVGKGVGRRAWSPDRHPLWKRYVDNHLGGEYQVRIIRDNLTDERAEDLEAAWTSQCSDTIVNWSNMGREIDSEALVRYHSLRDANRVLIQNARMVEKQDLEEAVSMYAQAIDAAQAYASISYEKGLVGRLREEEKAEFGTGGEIMALDRLTMCLVKLGRAAEAAERADNYFTLYRRDLQYAVRGSIAKRIEKALSRIKAQPAATRQSD